MEIVKVKNKYQIVIPEDVRREANIEIGDFLSVKAVSGGIKLEPKSLIARELAEALEEARSGKTVGPFKNASEMFKFLDSPRRKSKKKSK